MLINNRNTVFLVFLLAAVQVFFYATANYLGVGRTFINVDYFFILLISLLGSRLVSYLAMVSLLLVDLFMLVVQILPFTRATEFLYFLTRLEYVNHQYILVFLSAVIIFIVFSVLFIRVVNKAENLHKLVIFNIFIFVFYILGNNNNPSGVDNRFYRVANVPVVDSVFLYAYDYRTSGFVSNSQLKEQEFEKSLDERSFCKNVGCENFSEEQKILFILNESWGEYKDPSINNEILKNISTNYEIDKSYVNFSGVTVAAEFKELCGLKTNSFYLKNASSEALSDCFPNRIINPDYKVVSYHGAGSTMYDRYYWYEKVGFDESYFYDNYPWQKRCHSFPGACDEEISKKIVSDIKKSKSGFFYWLTLNTHHNYNLKDLHREVLSCSDFNLKNDEVCRNTKLQHQFFLIVEDMIEKLKEEKLTIYVLGDHVPPVTNMEDKEKYFHIGKVPWIKIKL